MAAVQRLDVEFCTARAACCTGHETLFLRKGRLAKYLQRAIDGAYFWGEIPPAQGGSIYLTRHLTRSRLHLGWDSINCIFAHAAAAQSASPSSPPPIGATRASFTLPPPSHQSRILFCAVLHDDTRRL